MVMQCPFPDLEASPQEQAYLKEIKRLNKLLDLTEQALKLKTLQCNVLSKEVGSLRLKLSQLPLLD